MLRACYACIFGLALFLAGCATRDVAVREDAALLPRIDAAIAKGRDYLVSRQSPDGAFRSSTYGFMKDGPSLTPHVLVALADAPSTPGTTSALARGRRCLVTLSEGDLSAAGLIFPVYTAGDAVLVLGREESSARNASRRYLAYLLSHRLGAESGWSPGDLEFGGWGYALQPSRRPPPGTPRGPWDFSNLSATLAALRAIHGSDIPPNDPLYADVLRFVRRCQNFPEGSADARFDDGGFYFSPAEPLRNKAGVAGTDAGGKERFHSYGSMTADGAMALLLCGRSSEHPRVVAARDWLVSRFSAEHNPGDFSPETEDLRDATYFYYCRGVAELFERLKVREVPAGEGSAHWAALLAEALIQRQGPDGAWANRFTDAREDDPLVSTPLALHALLACRRAMAH